MTTRSGGASAAPFDSLNLKAQTSDPLEQIGVAENRRRYGFATLGATPVFLEQVHGTCVVRLIAAHTGPDAAVEQADASITTVPGIACTVLVADCLPVLFATRDGRAVGAAHVGLRAAWPMACWRATVDAIRAAVPVPATDIVAWLGASIGPRHFEVGDDVRAAFNDHEFRATLRACTGGGRRAQVAGRPARAGRRAVCAASMPSTSAAAACAPSATHVTVLLVPARPRSPAWLASAAWIDVS